MESLEDRERHFHDRIFADGTRRRVAPYYALTGASQRWYERRLLDACSGRRVLEYGCGTGSKAFLLAERGANVLGIDISPVAIERSREEARSRGLTTAEFRPMNAHALEIDDGSFDLVCGSGILHHLQIDRAYAEIARVLRPDGRAIFLEPLGHNPLINLYRRRTPELRTPDEHPLLQRDIAAAAARFRRIDTCHFHLATLAAAPLRRSRVFARAVNVLDRFDQGLFRWLPLLRKHAWIVVLELSEPTGRTDQGSFRPT